MGQFFQRHVFNQLFSSFTAFISIFTAGLWLGWFSAVLPKFKAGEIPIDVTASDITWMVALMDFGNLLSPIPSGYLMDRFGRLTILRMAAIPFFLASVLALVATTPHHLFAARLFAGIGKGIGFTVAPMYVAEIAASKFRGALSGIFVVMLTSGSACIMTFGPYISFDNLNRASMIFPIMLFTFSFFATESPYFFFMRDDDKSAVEAFYRLRDDKDRPSSKIEAPTNTTSNSNEKETPKSNKTELNIEHQVPESHMNTMSNENELDIIRHKVQEDTTHINKFQTLVETKSNRKALTIVLTTGVLQRLGGISCILAYASTTLPSTAFWDQKFTMMVFGWSSVVFGMVSMSLVDNFGRKPLLLISATGLCVSEGISAIFYYFHQVTKTDVTDFIFVPHVGIMLFSVFYSIGVGQITHTFQSELFPTSVKGTASAITTICVAIASFVVNKIYLYVDGHIGVYFMYLIFAFSNFICIIFTVTTVLETKGKTLSEIQDLLKK